MRDERVPSGVGLTILWAMPLLLGATAARSADRGSVTFAVFFGVLGAVWQLVVVWGTWRAVERERVLEIEASRIARAERDARMRREAAALDRRISRGPP